MDRKPEHQPYADATPVLYPGKSAFARRIFRVLGNLAGAIILVALANVVAVTYISGFAESPYNYLRRFLERVTVNQIVAATASGQTSGEAIARLRGEVNELRVERDSLRLLIKKSSVSSQDLLSISKLELSSNGLYWQVLVRPLEEKAGDLMLDVRFSNEAVVPDLPSSSARSILVKDGAELFDGVLAGRPDRFLVVSLFSAKKKALLEARVLPIRKQ